MSVQPYSADEIQKFRVELADRGVKAGIYVGCDRWLATVDALKAELMDALLASDGHKADADRLERERDDAKSMTKLVDGFAVEDVNRLISERNALQADVARLRDALHDAEAIGDFATELRDRLALKENAEACAKLAVEATAERDALRVEKDVAFASGVDFGRAEALEDAVKTLCVMCRANMELIYGSERMLDFKDGAWVDLGNSRSMFHHRIPGMSGIYTCEATKIRALAGKDKS